MNKKLTLLIFLFPMLVMGQAEYKNGTISFDFGKKKKTADSLQQQQAVDSTSDQAKQKKEKKPPVVKNPTPKEPPYDWRKDGIFKAIFHGGITASQIDGDGYAGYNYLGAEGGVGALIRFHPLFSASMELNYVMKGARQNFVFTDDPESLQKYQVQLDYIELPLAINVYAKNLIMFTGGLSIAVLVRDWERDEYGQVYATSGNFNLPPPGLPDRYDFCGFLGLHFIIHKNFLLGGQFSYSIVKIRGPREPGISHFAGEFNNDLAIDFMYIMSPAKKNKHVRGT